MNKCRCCGGPVSIGDICGDCNRPDYIGMAEKVFFNLGEPTSNSMTQAALYSAVTGAGVLVLEGGKAPEGWDVVDTTPGKKYDFTPDQVKAWMADQWETDTEFEYVEEDLHSWYYSSVWDGRAHVYRVMKHSVRTNELDVYAMSFDPGEDEAFSSWGLVGSLAVNYTIDDLPFADPEGNHADETNNLTQSTGEVSQRVEGTKKA